MLYTLNHALYVFTRSVPCPSDFVQRLMRTSRWIHSPSQGRNPWRPKKTLSTGLKIVNNSTRPDDQPGLPFLSSTWAVSLAVRTVLTQGIKARNSHLGS